MAAMNADLKARLISDEFGLTEEEAGKLEKEGVVTVADVLLLDAGEFRNVSGCGLVTSKKVMSKLTAENAPVPVPASVKADTTAEIPEGKNPSKEQVASFANQFGIDPSMLMVMMMGGAGAGAGLDMDLSSMIPVAQVAGSYNPKLRNLPYLVMGQIEARLGGNPIVVINPDGSVNPAFTADYVMQLEEGRDPVENNVYYNEAGEPFDIIKVGVDAQSVYDADPVDPGSVLQKNGMGTGRVKWGGVSLAVRQVVYFATQSGELSKGDEEKVRYLREHIKVETRPVELSAEFPLAYKQYLSAARLGTLPTLKAQLTRGPRRPEIMPRRRARVTPAEAARAEEDSSDSSSDSGFPRSKKNYY